MNPKTFRSRKKTIISQRDTPPQTARKKKSTIEQQGAKIRAKSSCQKSRQNYNKYYIHPELRYRSKMINPKQVPENYTDQTFLYKNLHNTQFWNWTHPLDFTKLKPIANPAPDKANVSVLEKFRNYMQQTAGKRVPLVIRDYLHQYSARQ